MIENENYERVAMWLDDRRVKLTADEQALADELLRGEADIYPRLDVRATRRTLDRAHSRMLAELARPVHRTNWFGATVSAMSAVAVVVLLAVAGIFWSPWGVGGVDGTVKHTSMRIQPAPEQIWNLGADENIDSLDREIGQLEAEISPACGTGLEHMSEIEDTSSWSG